MHADRPSLTALFVAAMRGLAEHPDQPGQPLDPTAERLLPWPWGDATRRAHPWVQRGLPKAVLRWNTLGLSDHIVLRTLAIDHALQEAVARGARQLVVLGAGLDGRPLRLACLADVTVWEVDHPSTQALREPAAPQVRRVPVDFDRDDLGASLERAGHDVASSTVWIWEGVTPYLPEAATRATLAVVASRSTAGSRLLVTYATPDMISLPDRMKPYGLLGFRLLGEPLAGMVDAAGFARWLTEAGFEVLDDTGAAEWSARFAPQRAPRIVIEERLAIAERR